MTKKFTLKGLNVYKDGICVARFSTDRAGVCEIKKEYLDSELPRQISDWYGIYAMEVREWK